MTPETPEGRRKKSVPIPFTDEYGMPCLRVPLGNAPGIFAIIDRHRYDDLISQGLTAPWFLNGNGTGRSYVRTAVPVEGRRSGTNLLIARLIIGAGPGSVVRYANGNPLDLRFINLAWRKGKAKGADLDTLAASLRARPQRNAAAARPTTSTAERNLNAPT